MVLTIQLLLSLVLPDITTKILKMPASTVTAISGALTIRSPTLRLCYNSTCTVRPSNISSMQQYATLCHQYDMSRDITPTSGHSVACVRTSTGDQRYDHLTVHPPCGTSTVWNVHPSFFAYQPIDYCNNTFFRQYIHQTLRPL